jgi:hypothetical protein
MGYDYDTMTFTHVATKRKYEHFLLNVAFYLFRSCL